jgi:hypothetical protein
MIASCFLLTFTTVVWIGDILLRLRTRRNGAERVARARRNIVWGV